MSTADTLVPAPPVTRRLLGIATGWGLGAGAVTALVLAGMTAAQELIWSVSDSRLYIAAAVVVGGIILTALRPYTDELGVDDQLAAARDPAGLHRRRFAILTASAVIAVAFGGSIGPEAGLVGVVTELSALVGVRLARGRDEERLLGQAGASAALAGLYGSPPGATAYDDDALGPTTLLNLVAAGFGFAGFVVVMRVLGGHGAQIDLPAAPEADLLTLVRAVPAALLGCAAALCYQVLHTRMRRGIERCGTRRLQTLVGSIALAATLTAWPLLRFSGHEQLTDVARLAESGAWWVMVALAVAKAGATALSLAAGWRGGEFFPLVMTGAAAGTVAMALVPGLDVTTAMVAGLAAAATVGLRKPLAVILIGAFLIPSASLGPLVIGSALGTVTTALLQPSRDSDPANGQG